MRRNRLNENIKCLSENKKGICSIQVIIITLASLLFFSYILESTSISLKTISKRQHTIQEKLVGESLFQIVDLYVIQEFEDIYNKAGYEVVKYNSDNEIIKLKILRYSCFELWSKGVSKIGCEISSSKLIKALNLKYKEIGKIVYTYDSSEEKEYFIMQSYLNTKNIFSSKDFGITIKVTVYTEEDIISYSKDYIFTIPLYKDEDIAKIKADKEGKLNIKSFEFDETNIVSSEVYYEQY